MNNTLFEQFSGKYTRQGDYLLPNLTLPAEEATGYIGVWGQRRLNYLKHHKVLYYNLLTSGQHYSHLADTEEQAQQLFPAGKRTRLKRKCNQRTQINRYDALGAENE